MTPRFGDRGRDADVEAGTGTGGGVRGDRAAARNLLELDPDGPAAVIGEAVPQRVLNQVGDDLGRRTRVAVPDHSLIAVDDDLDLTELWGFPDTPEVNCGVADAVILTPRV